MIRPLVFVVVLVCSLFAQERLHPPIAAAGVLRLMEKWRTAAKLGPIGSKAAWIAESTFGHADETMHQLKPAR